MAASLRLEDYAAQLRAILAHDVSGPFRGDLQQAASPIRARVFVVYSPDDHVVTSGPTVSFARQLKADTLSVPSVCGHGVFRCELSAVGAAVGAFLVRAAAWRRCHRPFG